MRFGIIRLYCGECGKKGFYNLQEVGLARAMRKKGLECFIFFPNYNLTEVSEEIVAEGITLVTVPAKHIGVHAKFDWRVLISYNIEIVQIGSDTQLFAPSLISFLTHNRIRFYNYIGTIESDSGNPVKKEILNCLMQENFRKYRKSMCFAKTISVYDKLKEKGIENVDLMPVGLDLDAIPKIERKKEDILAFLKIKTEKPIISFVARLEYYKNPMALRKIINMCKDRFFFVIVGDGNMANEFKQMLEENLNENDYKWFKQLPNKDIHNIYAIADYYVNFNPNEIFGMGILEAMLQGCNVVAIHAPGPDMIIENEKSGFLVDNVEEIANTVLFKDRLKRETIINRVLGKYTWDVTSNSAYQWICKGE